MPIFSDRILYQDDSFVFVNKLSGELVVKGSGIVEKLPLLDFLRKDFPGLKPVNRLDFATSGIVIFAKNTEAFEAALAQMSDWKKFYLTLVKGRLGRRTGIIRKSLAARNSKGAVAASTWYTVRAQFSLCSLVECKIQTGRHHQIRKHFASIHHPLVLDDLYGDEKFNKAFRRSFKYRKFFLHAVRLELTHPLTAENIMVEAPLPKVFQALLQHL